VDIKDSRSPSLEGVVHCGGASRIPDSDPESLGEAIYVCASGWDNLAFALGRGVAPANAVRKFAHGVDCVSSGLTSESKSIRRGCGVGNLSRGRDVEFITDNKKERRRACGVIGFSSLSSAGRCDGVPAGVWNGWMSKRALGRGGKAGVGVNDGEGSAEENVLK
jgi:hypothetical protein